MKSIITKLFLVLITTFVLIKASNSHSKIHRTFTRSFATAINNNSPPIANSVQTNTQQPLPVAQPLTLTTPPEQGLEQQFAVFFDDPSRTSSQCKAQNKFTELKDQLSALAVADLNANPNLPRKKENTFASKNYGFDESAHFFDYLDPIFQETIAKIFEDILNSAKAIVPDQSYIDPYSLQSMSGLTNSTNEQEMLVKVKELIPSYNHELAKMSISAGQIKKIAKEWNWSYDSSQPNYEKTLVDTYDFNGDGRLSPKEFLLLMIVNNKDLIGSTNPCMKCMNEFQINHLDLIYEYIDCNKEGLIQADLLWEAMRRLKRNSQKYNIYTCQVSKQDYRTNTMNDFIQNSQSSVAGKLSIQDFRQGILLGYWERQVEATKVLKGDERTKKSDRWSADGAVDIGCNTIIGNIQKLVKNLINLNSH